jgi:hypothetical protein
VLLSLSIHDNTEPRIKLEILILFPDYFFKHFKALLQSLHSLLSFLIDKFGLNCVELVLDAVV